MDLYIAHVTENTSVVLRIDIARPPCNRLIFNELRNAQKEDRVTNCMEASTCIRGDHVEDSILYFECSCFEIFSTFYTSKNIYKHNRW